MLSLQLDGPLDAERAARLAGHLSACASCARAAESLAKTWRRIGAVGVALPAPDDFAAIVARFDRRANRWRDLVWRVVPARPLLAASLAASVLVGSTAGFSAGTVAFRRERAAPPEIALLDESLGELPLGSPAIPVARAFTDGEVRR